MFKKIIKPLRTDLFFLGFNGLFLLVFLALTIYVKLTNRGWYITYLFNDPFLGQDPYLSLFTPVSDLLWCVALTICVFSLGLVKTIQPSHKVNLFLLYSAIGIGVLLLDDAFRTHLFLKEIGIPKTLVYLAYGIAALAYVLSFWRIIRATSYILLVLGIVLLTISIVVDITPLEGQGTLVMLEDGTKLLGVLNITLYFRQVCWQSIMQSLNQRSHKLAD